MNLFSVGQSFNTSVPDVYMIEDFGLPPVESTIGSSIIGIVGEGLWGADNVIYQTSNPADLVKLFGGRTANLGRYIDAISNSGRHNIAAIRVTGAGAAPAECSIEAGIATTWDFAWTFNGAKGNDTTLDVVAGSIADTVTLIFTLDSDTFRVTNVNNDPDSANYIGDKFNVPNMTFTKTGTAITLPTVTASPEEFASGADGAAASDADLITAADTLFGSTQITHFMFASPSNDALVAAHSDYSEEYQVFIFQTTIENEIVDEFAACITEAKSYTDKFVATCMGDVYYYNRDNNTVEEIPLVGFITMAAKYGYAGSPIGKDSPYNWVQVWNKLQREQMSDVHLCYARNDGLGWYINDLRLGIRDEYQSSPMVRGTYNIVETMIARNLRKTIGMSGGVDDRKARVDAMLRGVGEYLVDRSVIEGYAIDTSKITSQSVARGELLVDFYVEKYPENRRTIVHIKQLTDGRTNFSEEVI